MHPPKSTGLTIAVLWYCVGYNLFFTSSILWSRCCWRTLVFSFLSCCMVFNLIVLREYFNPETYLNEGNSWHQQSWMTVEKFCFWMHRVCGLNLELHMKGEPYSFFFQCAQLLEQQEATKSVLGKNEKGRGPESPMVLFRDVQSLVVGKSNFERWKMG